MGSAGGRNLQAGAGFVWAVPGSAVRMEGALLGIQSFHLLHDANHWDVSERTAVRVLIPDPDSSLPHAVNSHRLPRAPVNHLEVWIY